MLDEDEAKIFQEPLTKKNMFFPFRGRQSKKKPENHHLEPETSI